VRRGHGEADKIMLPLGQGPEREELEHLGAMDVVGSQQDDPDEMTAGYYQRA
jgi:hypothetical protein